MAKNTSPKRGDSKATKDESSGTAVLIAKPTIAKGNGTHESIYDDGVKEIVALSENDTYARKVDNGPLSEARGKDVWQIHTSLRAINQLGLSVDKHSSTLKTAASTIDEHLHADTVAVTQLVERHGTNLSRRVGEATSTIEERIGQFQSAVKASFDKLSRATAGTEENLRTQTDSFSKAVEELLLNVQNDLDKKIMEFRDESTRLMDKRFNQIDVTFASVRADQEVIKALLTDIIKDRMGRSEPRVK